MIKKFKSTDIGYDFLKPIKKIKIMNLKNSIPSNKLRFAEFNSGRKSACAICNEWLKRNDVMVLDYRLISYGYQNSNHKIVLAYVESDKKNV